MNRYHRYLKLPFDLQKPEICDQYIDSTVYHEDITHRDPNLETWLSQFEDICIGHTEVFWTNSGEELPIHTDEDSFDDHVKINVSWGSEKGLTRWWKSDIVEYMEEEGGGHVHRNLIAEKENSTLVYEACTNTPSLVNVGQLHSSYNPSDSGRWTLCFVLANEDKTDFIYWDDALKMFEDYVYE